MEAMNVGFIFSEDLNSVLLLKKNRPDWQVGFYNGVGGHLTKEEMSKGDWIYSWIREVKEEVNLDLEYKKVIQIGRIVTNDITVIVYAYRLKRDQEYTMQQMTDESPLWVIIKLYDTFQIIENLSFFIPLARYVLKYQNNLYSSSRIELHYKS